MASDQENQEATAAEPEYYVLPDAVQRATELLARAEMAGLI